MVTRVKPILFCSQLMNHRLVLGRSILTFDKKMRRSTPQIYRTYIKKKYSDCKIVEVHVHDIPELVKVFFFYPLPRSRRLCPALLRPTRSVNPFVNSAVYGRRLSVFPRIFSHRKLQCFLSFFFFCIAVSLYSPLTHLYIIIVFF